MIALQLVCAAIVALYLVMRARRAPGPGALARRLALLAIAGWVGEDSVIHAYRYYAYAPGWSLFLDEVPLLIVLIWPVVIHSAWELSRQLLGARRRFVPLLGGALVVADASLIEPIAVHAGLWSWSAPGLFHVPPIGILGWGLFAAACMALLERAERGPRRLEPLVILVAPAATHALLLASWWGALRFVSGPVSSTVAVAAAWALALALAAVALARGARKRVALADMLARVPAALFFFALLGLHRDGAGALLAWAFAFAPPWLALCDLRPGASPTPEASR